MDLAELERRLRVGRARSVCVDARPWPGLPGMERRVTIFADLRVIVELEVAGSDEGGGPSWLGRFATLDEVVVALEAYLGRPLASWQVEDVGEPFSAPIDLDERRQRLAETIRDFPLPALGDFQRV